MKLGALLTVGNFAAIGSLLICGTSAAAAAGQRMTAQPAPESNSGAEMSRVSEPNETEQKADAVTMEGAYVSEVWSAVDGGASSQAVLINQVDIGVMVDLGEAAGWEGASAYVQGSYNDGGAFSNLAGDAQIVSNIEAGVKATRLYEAWVEQELGDASIKVGLIDLNTEFDVIDSAGVFINSAHGVGSILGLSGENGPSIFPVTSLAGRADFTFRNDWKIRAAIFDGVPGDPDNPDATVIQLGEGDGALLIGELEVPLAEGKLLFGHWRYTGQFEAIDGDRVGGNSGWYLRGEHEIAAFSRRPARALSAFFRFGRGNGAINPFSLFVSGGLALSGPFAARPEDTVGIAVASAVSSDQFVRAGELGGGAETNIELTYSAQITPWLWVQPDVQYIVNPAASGRGDVIAFGMRTQIEFRF